MICHQFYGNHVDRSSSIGCMLGQPKVLQGSIKFFIRSFARNIIARLQGKSFSPPTIAFNFRKQFKRL